jgi:hypothetical protein
VSLLSSFCLCWQDVDCNVSSAGVYSAQSSVPVCAVRLAWTAQLCADQLPLAAACFAGSALCTSINQQQRQQ